MDPITVEADLEACRKLPEGRRVIGLDARLVRRQRHAAVHRPGVEVGDPELSGDRARDR